MCRLCAWEDDGQDDDCQDDESEPNGGYTLAEARRNAVFHGSMYHPDDPVAARWKSETSQQRKLAMMRMYESLLKCADERQLAAQVATVLERERTLFEGRAE